MRFYKSSPILIAGANGMVGSSFVRILKRKGFKNLLTPSKKELNYLDKKNVRDYLNKNKPFFIICAAARVGGINANNTNKVNFYYENIEIQNNLISESHLANIDNLLFLGSSCVYPRDCKQPIKEEYLLKGQLEKTNEPYALAKISGIKFCEYLNIEFNRNYFSVMPTNLYGPNDNYDLLNSHVLPALIHKFHKAKIKNYNEVEIWGSGKPKREFLYVDDLVEASILLMFKKRQYRSLINIGSEEEITIRSLSLLLSDVIYKPKEIKFNKNYPDGTPRKVMDSSYMKSMGWKPKYDLLSGIKKTYKHFLSNYNQSI